jgi:hypothetical protein
MTQAYYEPYIMSITNIKITAKVVIMTEMGMVSSKITPSPAQQPQNSLFFSSEKIKRGLYSYIQGIQQHVAKQIPPEAASFCFSPGACRRRGPRLPCG